MGDDIWRNGEKPAHWGLAGMRERAKVISGELNIWSREGKGTEVGLVMRKSGASRGARKPGWRERLTRKWRACSWLILKGLSASSRSTITPCCGKASPA